MTGKERECENLGTKSNKIFNFNISKQLNGTRYGMLLTRDSFKWFFPIFKLDIFYGHGKLL